jgi:hypothetical protein
MLRPVRAKGRVMAETQYSLRIVKTFTYRGDPTKEFSNRYFFNGGDVGDASAWHTLMDAIVLLEKTIYPPAVSITDAFGYAPGTALAVASKAYTTAGTAATTGGIMVPGDCTATVRFGTTKVSSKNHQVFVFSYYHGVMMSSSSGIADAVLGSQRTAIEAYAQDWVDGISVASRTYKRTTPDGHLVEGRLLEPWIGHRDFPR